MFTSERKEIKHNNRQVKPGYCSPILLSNIFNDQEYYDIYLKDERFFGSGDEEWKEMIERKFPQLKLNDVLYINQCFGNGGLTDLLIDQVVRTPIEIDPSEELPIFCYFLTVKRMVAVGDVWHSVAILNVGGTLWYSDPYNESMYTFDHVVDLFSWSKCHRIQTLFNKEDEKFAFLRGDVIFGSKVIKQLKNG